MVSHGRFIAYLRVSTDKQGKSGLGLEAQRTAVTNYLNGGKWKIIAEFTEVESGKIRNNLPVLSTRMAPPFLFTSASRKRVPLPGLLGLRNSWKPVRRRWKATVLCRSAGPAAPRWEPSTPRKYRTIRRVPSAMGWPKAPKRCGGRSPNVSGKNTAVSEQ